MLHIFLAPFAKFCPDCGAWPERQKRKKNRVVSGEFEDGTDGPSIPVVLGQAGGGSFRAEILFCRTQTYRIGRQSSDGVEWNYCSRGLLGHLGTAYPIPKTIQKRYTKRYFRFRFARHPPFRTSMTSLLLLLLALACAGHQLCGCLCWRCWWCLCCSWWCKNLGKRPRAALRKSGLSAAESSVVTTLTEHRWRVTERSADVVEEALAEAMFCVVRNV